MRWCTRARAHADAEQRQIFADSQRRQHEKRRRRTRRAGGGGGGGLGRPSVVQVISRSIGRLADRSPFTFDDDYRRPVRSTVASSVHPRAVRQNLIAPTPPVSTIPVATGRCRRCDSGRSEATAAEQEPDV